MKSLFNQIYALIIGHLTVFKHLFKKPVTLEYPEKKKVFNENFRGVHALVVSDDGCLKCTGCGLCKMSCPANAIEIVKEEGKLKKYNIDLGRCIFCGNCIYACPNKSLIMSKNYELANVSKSSLNLDINTLKNNYFETIINQKGKSGGN